MSKKDSQIINIFDKSKSYNKIDKNIYEDNINKLYLVKYIGNGNIDIAVRKCFTKWESSTNFRLLCEPQNEYELDIFDKVILKNIREGKYTSVWEFYPLDITAQFLYFVNNPDDLSVPDTDQEKPAEYSKRDKYKPYKDRKKRCNDKYDY